MALPTQFTPKCPGCGKPMGLVDGMAVHFADKHLWKEKFYVCMCSTYEIMCQPGTLKPKGRPGDATLRGERRWVDAKIGKLIESKARRDNITKEAAEKLAWEWVSKIVKKDVTCPEELDIPEMGHLVPELRKF